MHNSIGHNLRLTVRGASHAPSIGVRIDGVPAGIPLSPSDFASDIDRRRPGSVGTTRRTESDIPSLKEGVVSGITTGETVDVEFINSSFRSQDYSRFGDQPRPSHADLVARRKYGPDFDMRGGGPFSGRMTLLLVAAGVVAKKILPGLCFSTCLTEVGGETDPSLFGSIVSSAAEAGDSVGGVVECRVGNVPQSLGEPLFDSAESVISHLLFSIPAVKGVEFGSGFAGVRMLGSQRNDRIIDSDGTTLTNNEGGINGGITNGNALVVRAAIKPTSSIFLPQQTFDFSTGTMSELRIGGRHDACIALRAQVVVEAAVAVALADLSLER